MYMFIICMKIIFSYQVRFKNTSNLSADLYKIVFIINKKKFKAFEKSRSLNNRTKNCLDFY